MEDGDDVANMEDDEHVDEQNAPAADEAVDAAGEGEVRRASIGEGDVADVGGEDEHSALIGGEDERRASIGEVSGEEADENMDESSGTQQAAEASLLQDLGE